MGPLQKVAMVPKLGSLCEAGNKSANEEKKILISCVKTCSFELKECRLPCLVPSKETKTKQKHDNDATATLLPMFVTYDFNTTPIIRTVMWSGFAPR